MNHVMTASPAEIVDLRTAHRDDTRRVILEAFLELLDDESPLTVSMPEVAARAGVSVRTLYRYFPNKEALLAGANEWFSARAQQMIGNRMVGLDALGVYLENVWSAFSENVAAVRVQHTSAGGREFRARRTESTRQTIDAGLPAVIPADRRGDVVDLIAALARRRCSSSSSSASVTPQPTGPRWPPGSSTSSSTAKSTPQKEAQHEHRSFIRPPRPVHTGRHVQPRRHDVRHV